MLTVLGLWILPGLVSCLTPLGHKDIIRRLRTPLITAFATGSTLVVLPMLAKLCKELIAEASTRPGVAEQEEVMSSVDVLIPTFFSFPTIGAILSLGFVLFAGCYIGSPVATQAYVSVISGGFASLFGGKALAILFTLVLAELPRDLFRLFVSTDVIVSRFGTLVSVMHYATIALICTYALGNLVRIRPWQLLRLVIVGALLVVAVLIGVRTFYTYVVVVPYTKDQMLKSLQNLRETEPSVVHRVAPTPSPVAETSGPRSLADIRDSGVLRVCYRDGNYPLVFFNADGELVGFDIEMAHRFAARQGLQLEFLPTRMRDDVLSGYCDVLFNSLALDLERADVAAHTDPFDTITLAFIVPTHRRDDFATWRAVRAQGEITVAFPVFQSLGGEIGKRIPQANARRLSSLEEQSRYFETDGAGADAFLDAAEEGAAWTVLYPRFTVVVPRPVVQLPVAYLVAPDNPSMLCAINEWLQIEKSSGYIDEVYDYWVRGKTGHVQPPRWSVIRDVLGWVK